MGSSTISKKLNSFNYCIYYSHCLIIILVLKIFRSYKDKALARENEILDQRKKTEQQQEEIDKQNKEIDRIKNEEIERQRID